MHGTTKLFHHVYPVSVSNWIQPTTEHGAYPPEIESFGHLSQFSREEHIREPIAAIMHINGMNAHWASKGDLGRNPTASAIVHPLYISDSLAYQIQLPHSITVSLGL